MDTSTRAAEPVPDATEPAPSADETESIYACAHADDDETLVIQRRSWKLPLAAALLAIAAVTTVGVVKVWPHHSTPGSPAAPAASPAVVAPAISPDVQFINLVNQGLENTPGFRGAQQGDPDAIATGHLVCEKMSTLWPQYGPNARAQIVQWMLTEGGAPNRTVAATVEHAAERAYCTQYGN